MKSETAFARYKEGDVINLNKQKLKIYDLK
jgi:hypothetical protein